MDFDIEQSLIPTDTCHCGNPVKVYDELEFTRGLCEHCDSVRCDAYPGACRDDFDGKAYE